MMANKRVKMSFFLSIVSLVKLWCFTLNTLISFTHDLCIEFIRREIHTFIQISNQIVTEEIAIEEFS
jgi:hypothetical protein